MAAPDSQRAASPADDAVAYPESQARAVFALGGEERFEKSRTMPRVNAATGIGDGHAATASGA